MEIKSSGKHIAWLLVNGNSQEHSAFKLNRQMVKLKRQVEVPEFRLAATIDTL